ncbi:disease resistance protein RGA2-like [Triticum dicoccoides]|uniref:disease resistance protein RGA2-like n=1 Tax=Triticum dicoccoides TaxID=85692 RepID=UPI000E7AB61E|nr:disease resistance protein RGA2-like [Triticum dicoccoides]XP_037487249.1 disease resistance protein RGA2-like [Triticum dicoccoides]
MSGLLGTVVDAAIGWLVESILGNFFTGHMESWIREIGLAEDVEKLKFQMRYVQMVLAAAKGRRIDNMPLAQSLDDLRELLYDSEDVMDELDYYRLQQQIEEGKGCTAPTGTNPDGSYVSSSTLSSVVNLVLSATSQITDWISRGRKRKREEEGPAHCNILPFEIKDNISKRINVIVNLLHSNGNSVQGALQLEILRPMAASSKSQNITRNAHMTTSHSIERQVYGRDAERDEIIDLLIKGGCSDLNILPVVGIGGIGKTTLARYVYHDERITNHFDLKMWICVSTNFSERRLTIEILEHVCEDRQEYENVSNFNVLQEILLKYIRKKRFLLVLDDMWEDKDKIGWIKLLAPLKGNQVSGCMILATTRMKSVAEMIQTMDEVRMSGLNEKEFWLLFKACAFGNENYEGDPYLQSIGKQIAKALKGCPLAAQSVGALLNTSVSHKHWRTVRFKWRSLQDDANDILPVLELSYDYLPVHLQHCFSYCSLFPEDKQFDGKELVHAWISQNFVQCEDPTMKLEETGQQYLDRLVDLCFFQKVGSKYVMHDLLHELAGKVSSNECSTIHGLKHEAIRPSVRHLSIITTAFDKDKPGSFPIEKFDKILQKVGPSQKLRTLMLFGRSSINLLGSLRTLCRKAKCLRFLRIYVTDADISSIHSLLNPYHLRYLKYIHVVITDRSLYRVYDNTMFPQASTRFYHLQVLNAGISGNFAVPSDMHNLVNLRHLISHEKVHQAIACVGNMTSLQELSFKVQNVGSFEISQLQYLNELVVLQISQLENVNTKEEASAASLLDKEYLETLSLSWEDNSTSLQPEAAKDVLEGLQPHQDLKTLEITGYGGATSPTWLSNTSSLILLRILHLEKCREWQILPTPEMLPFLRKLTLIRMFNLLEISVPSLEELILIDMPKLEKCTGSYGMELTYNLRVLMIKNCPQLNELTLFHSYSSFDAEQKSWFPSLRKLSIGQCPHILNNWPILPLSEMGALSELELIDLHVVGVSVPSLEKLVLTKIPNLEFCSSLTTQGDQMGWSSSLRRLTIHDCPCLIVPHPLPPSALISEMSIRGVLGFAKMSIKHRWFTIESNELSVLDDSILAFDNLRGITSFEIRNCPNLLCLSSEAFSHLIALEMVRINNCPNLTMSSIMPEVVQENCTSASSLVLPSLKSVNISKCGITGRWLSQLLSQSRSIEELLLSNCPQIKFASISQPTETEGTSSLASAVMTSAQDEQELKLPYNLLRSLKKLWIQMTMDLEFSGGYRDFAGCTSLTQLFLDGCPKLVSSLVETKDDGTMEVGLLPPSLEDLSIGPLPENLQSFTPQGLLYLKKLRLSNGPCLKSVQLHSCTALEELNIMRCVQLAVLEGLQFLNSLRTLKMEMTSKLSSAWVLKLQEQEQGGNQIQLLPPSLDKLELWALTDRVQSHLLSRLPAMTKLAVRRSPELTSLQLACCTALKELEIGHPNSLVSIKGLQFCRNLTSLKVFNSPGLASCLELVSHQQGASEIWSGLKTLEIDDASILSMPFCKQLTSLTHLVFSCQGSEQRESLVSLTGEQERALQLLTSLQKLEFWGYTNLLSLPANLHSLISLERLFIFRCQCITRLPDMGLPTSLRSLELSYCSEELGMHCRIAATEKLIVRIDGQYVN